MCRALIDSTRERQAFWEQEDFMRCLDAPISLKAVKQAQEANRSFIEKGSENEKGKRKRSVERRSEEGVSGKRWKS